MNTLTVLYEDGCPFCRRCRRYLEGAAQLIPLRLVPIESPAASALFGGRLPRDGQELIVVADDRAFWVGPDAFLVCLWALESHHLIAETLSSPILRPLATRFFNQVSRGRGLLSSLFGGGETCEGGHCGTAPAMGAYR